MLRTAVSRASTLLPALIPVVLAAACTTAYVVGWWGLPLQPGLAAIAGLAAGAAWVWTRRLDDDTPMVSWVCLLLVVAVFVALIAPTWPALLPPGGASDLTHHLMLVDVIERTHQLVRGEGADAALGEMAHYTPGLHLLMVIAAWLFGVEAYRTAYPLLAMTIALKGGLVFLIAHDVLAGARGRVPLAAAALGLVLFAPRGYSLDGFLQAGFFAQVGSELFVVAGWWALGRWWQAPRAAWMALVGLMGAAVFLVWPIWTGPLMLAVMCAVLGLHGLSWRSRAGQAALASAPFVVVAVMHLAQHAAWLRMAGTSGAVPALAPGVLGWLLMTLAVGGVVSAIQNRSARVTLWFLGGIAIQALVLWLLARARGAETPYMAMKMIYLAVYPLAVLGALGISVLVQRVPSSGTGGAWAAMVVVLAVGVRAAAAAPVTPPLVNGDLDAAGRWARENLQPACVDYVVDNAEQAYWLHLAVMGQPRSSARTADIDGYTPNRAVGRWIEGAALPYAIARRELLPGEIWREAEVLRTFGSAVVIRRPGVACPSPIAN